jgi:D-xylonolactonase
MSSVEGVDWRLLWPAKAHLGEGIIWDDRDECLYWLDVDAPVIHSYNLPSGARRSWIPPFYISSIAIRQDGGFIAGSRDGFAVIDPAKGRFEALVDPRKDPSLTRFNDGTLDRRGRFWSGTMPVSLWGDTSTVDREISASETEKRNIGELFRLDPSLTVTLLDTGYLASNGPAFSPDGRTLYENDSVQRLTYAYDLAEDGSLSGKRIHIHHDATMGLPDGMVCDADGGLWICYYDDIFMRRFGIDGKLIERRELPMRQALRPAFGGDKLDRLFIISGSFAFTEQTWLEQPLGGSLFEILNPGVAGIPTVAFAG